MSSAIQDKGVMICLVSGLSGSGKTTLIERLLPALAGRGVQTATAKHHRGRVALDSEGKDTWRHRKAGAKATFFVTEGELTAFISCPEEPTLEALAALCPEGVKLLLVEGFKGLTGYPRIEIVRRGVERPLDWNDEFLCVATDLRRLDAPCPVFDLDDAQGIADLLVQRLLLL